MKAEADPDKTENYCQIVPQFPAYNSYCKNMTILSLFPPHLCSPTLLPATYLELVFKN